MQPLFSVVIPTLNEEKYLPLLLTSLSAQHFPDFEVIVVDAHSADQTVKVAKSFAQTLPGVKTISATEANAAFQRNLGAKNSHGDWLIFVDADTVLMPSFFHQVSSYIKETNARLLTTWMRTDEHGLLNLCLTVFMNISYEFLRLIGRPMAPGPLTVIQRDTFYKIGQYDESRQYGEDYDLSLRATKLQIRFHIIPHILHVMSFRRPRKNGYIKMALLYLRTTISAVITGNVASSVPGYATGGHWYK